MDGWSEYLDSRAASSPAGQSRAWKLQKGNGEMRGLVDGAPLQSCRKAIVGVASMNGAEQYPASSRSVENLREVRLMALLRNVVVERGKVKAAETLGVSFRTLSRAEETGRLTPRLADALESHLVQGGGTAAARQRRQMTELTERVAALEKALSEGLGAVRHEAQRAAWEQSRALAELERRVTVLETAGIVGAPGIGTNSAGPGAAGNPATAGNPPASRPRRVYNDVVTAEPEPGEELVYGDAAKAVIIQWRQARDAFSRATDALDVLNARQRRVELEIELIQEYELTLPPATRPWDWGDRRQEVRRRNELLDETIVDRKLLRLRRFLTLGLWRK